MDDGADGNGSVLAPDIGGTRLAAGVVDAAGNTHSFVVEPSRIELGVDTVLADLFALGRRAVTESGVSWTDVGAVGIGCGGALGAERKKGGEGKRGELRGCRIL